MGAGVGKNPLKTEPGASDREPGLFRSGVGKRNYKNGYNKPGARHFLEGAGAGEKKVLAPQHLICTKYHKVDFLHQYFNL